jgi:YHS domain-containing protein
MIRFLILRIVVPLLVLWFVRGILRSLFAGHRQVVTRPRAASPPTSTELKKDPVCGTFVAVDAAVTKRVNGETLHFCSPACRDKYRAA